MLKNFLKLITRQGVDNSTSLSWKNSHRLSQAIMQTGVNGISFELRRVAVEDGNLSLTFCSLGEVPTDKKHSAGLALRCIVGLTLPSIAKSVGSIKILDQSISYDVKLGQGVPVTAIVLKSKSDRVGPLQMRSNETDNEWHVTVTHFVTQENYEWQLQMQNRIFQKLTPTFEKLKTQSIVL